MSLCSTMENLGKFPCPNCGILRSAHHSYTLCRACAKEHKMLSKSAFKLVPIIHSLSACLAAAQVILHNDKTAELIKIELTNLEKELEKLADQTMVDQFAPVTVEEIKVAS